MFLITKDFFKPKTSFSLQKSISVQIYEKMLLLFFHEILFSTNSHENFNYIFPNIQGLLPSFHKISKTNMIFPFKKLFKVIFLQNFKKVYYITPMVI